MPAREKRKLQAMSKLGDDGNVYIHVKPV